MIYTYECKKHGEFDITMSIKDHKNTHKCPQCKEIGKQIIYPVNFGGDLPTTKKPAKTEANHKDYKGKGQGYC